MDLELLMSTCNKMSVDDVFGEVLPEQPILLALLNQLPYNLHQDLEIKSSYLVETVLALDLTDLWLSLTQHTTAYLNNSLMKLNYKIKYPYDSQITITILTNPFRLRVTARQCSEN